MLAVREPIFAGMAHNFGVVLLMGGGVNSLDGVLRGVENNLQVVVSSVAMASLRHSL